jgi:hypothetical protein
MEAMIRFVDAYRDDHGVEPICRQLEIARQLTTRTPAAARNRRRHRRASSVTSS